MIRSINPARYKTHDGHSTQAWMSAEHVERAPHDALAYFDLAEFSQWACAPARTCNTAPVPRARTLSSLDTLHFQRPRATERLPKEIALDCSSSLIIWASASPGSSSVQSRWISESDADWKLMHLSLTHDDCCNREENRREELKLRLTNFQSKM